MVEKRDKVGESGYFKASEGHSGGDHRAGDQFNEDGIPVDGLILV